jgi:hypothetical protein
MACEPVKHAFSQSFRLESTCASQRAKSGFGCPALRVPELARARPSLRCAPFEYSCCRGGGGVPVLIKMVFYAEEMVFAVAKTM